jgi:hypothetical protein
MEKVQRHLDDVRSSLSLNYSLREGDVDWLKALDNKTYRRISKQINLPPRQNTPLHSFLNQILQENRNDWKAGSLVNDARFHYVTHNNTRGNSISLYKRIESSFEFILNFRINFFWSCVFARQSFCPIIDRNPQHFYLA